MGVDVLKVKLPPRVRMDCYRMAIYPILKYYGLDADLLFIKNDSTLGYKSELYIDEIECYNMEDMLNDFNIEIIPLNVINEKEIISVIKRAIDDEIFVICLMDVYYYSPFRAVFHKLHTVHGIPVYGYNEEKKVFYVIDSDYLESFNRTFLEVSYEDVINSVIGYSRMGRSFNIQLFVRTSNKEIPLSLMKEIRIKYAIQYGKCIDQEKYNGYVNEFINLYNYICTSCSSEKEMLNFTKKSYKYIDKFINARMLEYYGMPFVFKNIESLRQFNYITIEKSNLVRSIMYRTLYTGEYRKESFEKFPSCFEVILNREISRLDFINSFKWVDNIQMFKL